MIAIKLLLFLFTIFFQELNLQPNEELEIDRVWSELILSVKKGDFSRYKTFYHEDAVLISQTDKTSSTIKDAFIRWEEGFRLTRSGKIKTNLEVRFKKRLTDKKTFFEEGVLKYSTIDSQGNKNLSYLAFEALWIKKGEKWLMIMENQKSFLDEFEWNKLE
tara:strand:- start:5968 stop:6450 length:483 start_codon:yes stop_codon:yes gene_type:complete